MARAYEAAQDEEDDDDDDDDDVPTVADDRETPLEDAAAGGGGGSGGRRGALVFDASSGRPKLGLRQAFNSIDTVESWAIDAVFEYTVNRIYALRCRTPPVGSETGAPSADELEQLGKDLFAIDQKALIGAFRRERVQLARDRALLDDEDDDDEDEEEVLAEWTREREREFREAAVELWEATRREQAADMATLRAQLAAIKRIEEATAAGTDPADALAVALGDGMPADAVDYMQTWANDPNDAEWVRAFRRPRLRLPKIRDFLSQPSRSAIAQGYLKLLRDVHTDSSTRDRQTGILGSIYGSRWPAAPSAVSTPPDHVLPQKWYDRGTKLLIEAGDPGQLPIGVALSLLSENSGKSDLPLGHFQMESEQRSQGLYYSKASLPKRARMARITTTMTTLYPLITDRKTAAGIGSFGTGGGSGVSWYARAWQYGPMRELAQRPATAFERRINLITAAVPRWAICDALTFDTSALDANVHRVVERRWKGTDGIAKLVDSALRATVQAPPL